MKTLKAGASGPTAENLNTAREATDLALPLSQPVATKATETQPHLELRGPAKGADIEIYDQVERRAIGSVALIHSCLTQPAPLAQLAQLPLTQRR